ncbi:DUF885 domain-containing protein [Shewanella frigidimarina]|jgi:uncharacterized protein (DUF885 family)|uniref:DUF885 domain-containing protein n=1 Tax=Shewanella frigidimarina TaxID=56812 RepID=UPI000F4DDA36|nr:DUF885 domain-containing protein [Shewanella frigidimarina]RPA38363.1 DUF885 domain-containing protein [Shewanella frigidimarina]|tara:strand:+ start:382 stop:2238 length:1857 start_codon:yes stop_codon:yes gene_type:complete
MSIKTKTTLVAVALSSLLSASAIANLHNMPQLSQQESTATSSQQTESEKANALFEAIFMENVMANPVNQTYLGIKQDYGKWNDLSDAAADADLARSKQQLTRLTSLDANKLNEQAALSYELLKAGLEHSISDDKWRYHTYPINQMYGVHSVVASFLINQHQVTDESDAKAYISRLNAIPTLLAQLETSLEIRAKKHIIAPKFVFPYVISDSKNIITGAPFTDTGKDSALWADATRKINKLDITDDSKKALLAEVKQALLTKVKPAYEQLITYTKSLEARADTRDGAWKLPDGEAFYNNALARTTTTDMTADTIHDLGLSEVKRIHDEMRIIMKKVHFAGSLQEFFVFMRDDKQFYYPETDEGKTAYLAQAKSLIDTMESRLDEVFTIKPKAELVVRKVEAFREKSAGKAFYDQPAPDGSRPGSYYANLYKMEAMPKYQMEALAYHEGIPGHHMQIAIAQELQGIPKFRKFGGYTAYIEGWGLYSEYFPKEMGLYADPYSDFGRLSMELWRACRLVVDTGIHAKKWTREQAITYYVENTPNAESDAIKMVERHIVMPSQATAYKVGMIKILQLREQAKKALGAKFDIREFHTVILKNGPLPLDILEEQVNKWIKQVQSR